MSQCFIDLSFSPKCMMISDRFGTLGAGCNLKDEDSDILRRHYQALVMHFGDEFKCIVDAL